MRVEQRSKLLGIIPVPRRRIEIPFGTTVVLKDVIAQNAYNNHRWIDQLEVDDEGRAIVHHSEGNPYAMITIGRTVYTVPEQFNTAKIKSRGTLIKRVYTAKPSK